MNDRRRRRRRPRSISASRRVAAPLVVLWTPRRAGRDGQCCGDIRAVMTEFMGLAEKVSKFNQEALKHIERQTLNPFSGRFSRSPSPRPKFSKEEYGKPAAGSKTELRGQRAHTQISREILELCEVIHDMGARRRDPDGDECIIIPFGELFAFYTKISDKVVGLLIAAKKRGYVWFEPEILFQRRDDDVLIALLKPIEEIRNIITRQISASPSPAPVALSEASSSPTPSPLAQQSSPAPSEASSSSEPLPSPTISEESSPPTVQEQPTSTPAPLPPVEEDYVSESTVEPQQEQTKEEEQPSSTSTTEPSVEVKENTSTNEPIPPPEENTTATLEADQITQSTETIAPLDEEKVNTEPIVVEDKQVSEVIAVSVEKQPVLEQIIPNETTVTEPTTSTVQENLVSEAISQSSEDTQVTEPTNPTVEEKVDTDIVSDDKDSLTLKIIVEAESNEVLSIKSDEPNLERSSREEQNPSIDVQSSSIEETLSPTPEVNLIDKEQATPSSTGMSEPEPTIAISEKSEEVIPTSEKEQSPPSNDTGEKTLA